MSGYDFNKMAEDMTKEQVQSEADKRAVAATSDFAVSLALMISEKGQKHQLDLHSAMVCAANAVRDAFESTMITTVIHSEKEDREKKFTNMERILDTNIRVAKNLREQWEDIKKNVIRK